MVEENGWISRVRLMDFGPIWTVRQSELYPFKDDVPGLNHNFRAIRCALTDKELIDFDRRVCEKFERLRFQKTHFSLIEQINFKGIPCWLTEIRTDNCLINSMILYHQEQIDKLNGETKHRILFN